MQKESDPVRKSVVFIIKDAVQRSGLWNDGNWRSWCLVLCAVVTFLTTLLTQAVALFLAAGDAKKQFECFSVQLTFSGMGALKLRSLYFNKRSWLQLLSGADVVENEQLSDDIPEVDYESDNENNSHLKVKVNIQCYTNNFNSIATTISNIYLGVLIIFVLSPFFEWGYWKIIDVEMEDYPHILPGWNPLVEYFAQAGWIVTILAELVAAVYCVFVQLAFDVTSFGLMFFISSQFKLLREYSELVGGNGNYYGLSNKRDQRAHYRIKQCHNLLIALENSISELDILLRNILGIYFLVAIFTLCSVAVRLSTEEMSKVQLMNLLQYTGGILTQLFLFCYYGNKILHKSSVGMAEGPCSSAIWCLSPKVRREVVLLAIGMMRVRRLRAGLFNSLDLPSFIQIIRGAYSYYAVLQK